MLLAVLPIPHHTLRSHLLSSSGAWLLPSEIYSVDIREKEHRIENDIPTAAAPCNKGRSRDFPGGPAVKNWPCNGADMSSIPGQGTKIPHAMGQLSPLAIAREPAHLNRSPHVPQLRPTQPNKHFLKIGEVSPSPRRSSGSWGIAGVRSGGRRTESHS